MQVWSFFGEGQRRALTKAEDDSTLPPEFAPWVRFKRIQLSDSNKGERAAMEAIRSNGYYLYRGG